MKAYISKNLEYDKKKIKYACDFILFCAEKLPIEGEYKIYLVGKRKPYGITTTAVYEIEGEFEVHMVNSREPHGIATTALYEVGNNVCKVYCKGRALADTLRSIAHEMTHMMQDQSGLIVGKIKDAGGFHEDQANAKAGELLKLFAKSSPDRKLIYESLIKSD